MLFTDSTRKALEVLLLACAAVHFPASCNEQYNTKAILVYVVRVLVMLVSASYFQCAFFLLLRFVKKISINLDALC